MKISVVVPTCNRNDSLARCLDRLAPGVQSLPPAQYEVVVTDDGCPGTAGELVRALYPWVRWTAGPRRGPAANRNHGVRQALGEWIAFTDDDCLPSSAWLASYASAVTAGVELYEGRTTCEAGVNRFADDAPINTDGGILPSCNLLVSKRLFNGLGGFDEAFPYAEMEDTDFRDRLFARNVRHVFVPGASVDHPPRPRVTGWRAGARWQSRVYYDFKWGARQSFRTWLPVFVAKVRLRQMWNNYPMRDYPAAIRSLVAELAHVVRDVGKWERQYQLNSRPSGER